MHAADPAALVLSPGFSRHGDAELDAWLAAGGASVADAVAVHVYGEGTDVATMTGYLDAFRAVLRRRAVTLPLWVTEVGWDTWCDPAVELSYCRPDAFYVDLVARSVAALEPYHLPVVVWYWTAGRFVGPDRFGQAFGPLVY